MPSDLLGLPSLSFTPLESNYLGVDFILSPCTESGSATNTNLLEVLRTTRGKPMILHQDNLFPQRSELKESSSYRCNPYDTRSGSCPATLTTDKDSSLNGPHNHPDRSPNTLDKHRKRHRLHLTYSNSTDIQKPVRVLAAVLGMTVNNSLRIQHSDQKTTPKIGFETRMNN